jgi:hypothetical protein
MPQRPASHLQVLRKALMRYPKRETSSANTAAVEREIEAVQAEAVATATLIDVSTDLAAIRQTNVYPLPGGFRVTYSSDLHPGRLDLPARPACQLSSAGCAIY